MRSIHRKILHSMLVLAFAQSFVACSNDDDDDDQPAPIPAPAAPIQPDTGNPPAQTLSLVQTVVSDARFSTLRLALETAGLTEALEAGVFTVFAPTNDAFAKIPAETLNALLADKEALTRVLLYHVVPSTLLAKDVLANSTLKTANDLQLSVSLKDGQAFINDSGIIATDVLASNGVVHVIDTVLLPAAEEVPAPAPLQSLAEIVGSDANFSTLKLALETAGLVDVLKAGNYTVFAPNNAAFAKIPQETLSALLADKEALTRVLLYHVVPSTLLAQDVLASTSLKTANDLQLNVSLKDGKPFINDSGIIATNVLASNGVAHVIDSVLLPPAPAKNLVDIVIEGESFSTLETALIQAGLVDVLKSGNFTVFAPTNEAFAKIPAAALNALLADKAALTRVLLYHVVPNTLLAQDVLAAKTLKTANELELSVNLKDGKPYINDSGIIATDVLASNGVVHVIDSVLLPAAAESPAPMPGKSLVELVVNDPQFSILRDALIAADLVDALKEGPFTVFAPTNEAFAKIPAATLNALLADKNALTQVLLYHVVPGTLLAQDVLASKTLTSANALSLNINLREGKPFINDSGIIATDILANNGVVHVIDSVLLPASTRTARGSSH